MLDDLRALERLIDRGEFETDVRRMGVEQEMFLVDERGEPAPVAVEVLDRLNDPRFTTELAKFNLEANLDPCLLAGSFLSELEQRLLGALDAVEAAAAPSGAHVLLTGILPTLRREHLHVHNMTPLERYAHLNAALLAMRGGAFEIAIRGLDELVTSHDSVMIEAANTSFQLHYQSHPDDFARQYNLAQLLTAPLISAAVNSPVLLGRRLWRETRVALFERSLDTRSHHELERGQPPRVTFGDSWIRSPLDILRGNAVHFRPVLTCDVENASTTELDAGGVPPLTALALHNGTIWRWNRVCYGVNRGRPHLRIENRVLPAGPTVLDEVANAALFYGMMVELDDVYGDVSQRLPFEVAKRNFLSASQHGLAAGMVWLDDRRASARELLLDELIPAARAGLSRLRVPPEDIARYLGTVEERVRAGRTGAQWILDAIGRADHGRPRDLVLRRTTMRMMRESASGRPVHEWARPEETPGPHGVAHHVRDIMSTRLFAVRVTDVLDLATAVMDWQHIRHVPVEDADGRLVGLISHWSLLRALAERRDVEIEDVMDRAYVSISPDAPLAAARERLLEADAGCLLVVRDERLVGIVTERDFVAAAHERAVRDGET